jgi:hypothetical protein
VFVVFESGLAKRSKASEWNVKGRAILGVAVAKLSDKGGDLVGALTVDEDDEVLVIFEKGNIVRSRVDEVRLTGRNTMGVQFAKAGRVTRSSRWPATGGRGREADDRDRLRAGVPVTRRDEATDGRTGKLTRTRRRGGARRTGGQ